MPSAPAVPAFSVAGAFLEALAGQEFDLLATTLAPDVAASALTPGGLRSWVGRATLADQFAAWFGAPDFELVDAVVGEVGPRLHLRWRVRTVRQPGAGWSVVEQQAYVDTDATGHIATLSLLCSGFQAEAVR
jgi:hypothetical protein